MTVLKPMKPDNKPWDPIKVEANLPLMGLVKIDGIRAVIHDGIAYSNSLKPLPNAMLQMFVYKWADQLEGWDVEIGVGDPTDEYFFKNSHAFCMKADRVSDFKLYVFDLWNKHEDWQYLDRLELLHEIHHNAPVPRTTILGWDVLNTMEEVDLFAESLLNQGHEGAIFRRPDRPYKHGRATPKCGGMYKRKSRVDTEVTITAFNELMVNNNPKTTNELGRSQRSSHQDNKTPGGTLGSFDCSGFFEDGRPFTTKVGVFYGFTDEDKQKIWDNRDKLLNKPMKIKYMGIGSDQAPRTPVALGFRDPMDM